MAKDAASYAPGSIRGILSGEWYPARENVNSRTTERQPEQRVGGSVSLAV